MRRALCLVAITLIGCADLGARNSVWERNANMLAGQWSVRFDFGQRNPDGTPRNPAVGTLILVPNRAVDRTLDRIGLATNYGTYDVDFSALGRVPSGGRVPSLFVGVAAGDTMIAVFESDRESFSMEMRAPMSRDSIRGRWYAQEWRSIVGSGSFLMTRR